MGVLAFVKYVLRVRERRRPPAIAKHRIPAAMVEMQMGAKDVGDVLEAQARRAETVDARHPSQGVQGTRNTSPRLL
jgi:hypothetical protein